MSDMTSRVTEAMKNEYIDLVHEEMRRRGFSEDEIPRVIRKTGFMNALNKYPDVQLHYDPYDAVNEILVSAVRSSLYEQEQTASNNGKQES